MLTEGGDESSNAKKGICLDLLQKPGEGGEKNSVSISSECSSQPAGMSLERVSAVSVTVAPTEMTSRLGTMLRLAYTLLPSAVPRSVLW